MTKKTWLAWSSGKDSAWALHTLRSDPAIDLRALLTTVNETADRVAMHAVRSDLLRMQTRSLGCELIEVPIPYPCSNEQYEAAMKIAMDRAQREGIEAVAFGDLYLEDVRDYRIRQLSRTTLEPLFPIWGQNTKTLSKKMVDSGLRAVITCVDPKVLDESYVGRIYDESFLADLDEGIDPCGENGEFHSFAFAGPMFEKPLSIDVREIVKRDGFVFADVLPRYG